MKTIIKVIAVAVLVFISTCIGMPLATAANPSIEISIEEGYDGTAKLGRAYPIKITLKNNGSDFSGEMLLPFRTDYNLGGTKSIKIDLPANSEKVFKEIIPGATNNYSSNVSPEITIFEGERSRGKKIKVTGKTLLAPTVMEYSEPTLGLLSENPDRLKAIQLVKINGISPKIINLDDKNIPINGLGLQFFDVIVVDDYSISSLSEEQQQAIIGWINGGGVLLAGGSVKGHHAYGNLESLLPMKITGEKNLTDVSFLSAGEESNLNFSSLQVGTGTLQEHAEVKSKSEDTAIVVYKKSGNGEIWQTAFSLGEEPIASWSNYHKWFESLINQTSNLGINTFNNYESAYQLTYSTIGHVNELFAASQLSVGTIILIMIGYLILIAPILYIILLKIDKREHAWWIIPVASILMSVGIFGVGAKDRLAKPVLAEMGMYAANQNGDLSGVYTASVFSNRSGDYQLSIPRDGFTGIPVISTSGIFGEGRTSEAIMKDSMLSQDFHFQNVEYWATRSVVGQIHKMDTGRFAIDLELTGDQLKGTIENQYPYDFDELFIWSGSDIYDLGELKQGDSINVEQKLKHNLLMNPVENAIHSVGQELDELKKNELESTLIRNLYESSRKNLPIVFGYTRNNIANADIENKNEKNDRLSLIYVPFEAKGNMTGNFTLLNSQLSFDITAVTGQLLGSLDMYNQIEMENGTYDVTISLPIHLDHTKADFDSININQNGYPFLTIALLDQKTGDYVNVINGQPEEELKDDVGRFVSSEGKIMMRIEKNNPEHDPYIMFPEVTVKGAVK